MTGADMSPEILAGLEVGDVVCWPRRSGLDRRRRLEVGTIQRFTATQIVVLDSRNSEVRFRRDNGARVGSHYERLIDDTTPEGRRWRHESNVANAGDALTNAYAAWRRDPDSVELVQQIHRWSQHLLLLLDAR